MVNMTTSKTTVTKSSTKTKTKADSANGQPLRNGLSIGDVAPAFTLTDHAGEAHSLKTIKTAFTVVYFYPKDSTPGCTIEAIEFSALIKKFIKADATVLGISGGSDKTKSKFCEKHSLSVTLLSDTDFSVSDAYGVFGEKKFMGRTYNGIDRVSFLLDAKKRILKVYTTVKPKEHAEEVLQDVLALSKAYYL
jgi:thioredoxin-dependent peroxiredoxin